MAVPSEELLTFFNRNPHIRYVTPTSPDFVQLRTSFFPEAGPTPLGIARPQSAEDVARIISFVTARRIEISIRSGGHDVFGRAFVENALCIDMRDINQVILSQDKKSATIGGGILQDRLAMELAKAQLFTPVTSVGSVGYVGWCTYGGYSQFGGNYGMGVDQLIGAKVVNHHGKIVQADEQMLWALRGGGGACGVITELTIKVYPLDKILGGAIFFETTNISSTLKEYMAGYNALLQAGYPAALGLTALQLNTPFGKCVGVGIVWSSSDLATGREYIDHISSWGKVLMNTVSEMSVPEWQAAFAKLLPNAMYGSENCHAIRIFEMTNAVIDALGAVMEKMPHDPATCVNIHEQREMPSGAVSDGVYSVRKDHFLVEILATTSVSEKKVTAESKEWALESKKALLSTDAANLEPAAYINLSASEGKDSSALYGTNWSRFLKAKRIFDPEDVFRHALPKFEEVEVVQGTED